MPRVNFLLTPKQIVEPTPFNLLPPLQNNDTSPARFSKMLPFTNRTTLTCPMPNRVKRLRPFLQPILKRSRKSTAAPGPKSAELIQWNYMVYESFSTEDDVVVLAKDLNNRQGVNRPSKESRCMFGDSNSQTAVKIAVTSSVQEVFRCAHPNLTALGDDGVNSDSNSYNQNQNRVRISLEIVCRRAVKGRGEPFVLKERRRKEIEGRGLHNFFFRANKKLTRGIFPQRMLSQQFCCHLGWFVSKEGVME